MTSYIFQNTNDVEVESNYDIRLIMDDERTYVKPACKNIDSKVLQRLTIQAVFNIIVDGIINHLFCEVCNEIERTLWTSYRK